jgi:hypothetical protein
MEFESKLVVVTECEDVSASFEKKLKAELRTWLGFLADTIEPLRSL